MSKLPVDYPDAFPLPNGMTREEINALRMGCGPWRRNPNYVCKKCGQDCWMHPYTQMIWGCSFCGFTTASVSIYFTTKEAWDRTCNPDSRTQALLTDGLEVSAMLYVQQLAQRPQAELWDKKRLGKFK